MTTKKDMINPLVSIVTPCYNGEKFLDNYFEAILSQTYSNIELILVNDGSTDGSDAIIRSFEKKVLDKGIRFIYIDKENEGQMKAVQDGVLTSTGDFLTWPDVDDIMNATYVEEKVEQFINHPEADILINPSIIYDFDNQNKSIGQAWRKPFKDKRELIFRFIEDNDAGYMPGSYMLRMSSFCKIYTDKQFFCGIKAGVAIPLVFPFIYSGQAIYYNKGLYKYFIHEHNQHSMHGERDLNNLEILYSETIKYIPVSEGEKQELKERIENRCLQLKLGYAYHMQDKQAFYSIKKLLIRKNAYRLKDRIKEVCLNLGIIR